MLSSRHVSLNGVRIFALVAEIRSIKHAARQLGVTPGAVSRQVRNLELSMGVSLFERSNNTITLTQAGESFYQHSHPALDALDRSIEFAMNDRRELSVRVSTTLATRWLIPRLDEFRHRHPDIAVKIETDSGSFNERARTCDLSLGYVPGDVVLPAEEVLFEDVCRPYLAPRLLSEVNTPAELTQLPALQGTNSNWDWKLWLEKSGNGDTQLQYAGQFDLDDAAIRAAIAGMGMVLASEFLIQDDVEAGRLCVVPESHSVLLGYYTMKLSAPTSLAAVHFSRWLRKTR